MSDFRVRFVDQDTKTSKFDEEELFVVKVVQHTGNFTTNKTEDFFNVRFDQVLPPIYRVVIELPDLLNQIFANQLLLDSTSKLSFTKNVDLDSIQLPDGITFVGDKNLSLSSIVDEVLNVVIEKKHTDVAKASESSFRVLDKTSTDVSEIDQGLSKEFESVREELTEIGSKTFIQKIKSLFDQAEINDLFEQTIGKRFDNEVDLIDTFVRIVDYNRNNTEIVEILEVIQKELSTNLENVDTEVVSSATLNTLKNFIDASDVLDAASLALVIFAKDQINLVSEIINKNLQKSDSDSVNVSAKIDSISSEKQNKDTLEVQIKLLRILNKIISDSPLLNDEIEKSVSSVLENVSVVADDLQKFAELNRKLEDEAVTFEDSNVFDGSLFKLNKSVQSKSLIQEEVDLLTAYFRVFSHAVDTTFEIQKQLAKSIENDTTVIDKDTISYLKSIENDLLVSLESLVLEISKRLSSNAVVDGTFITKEVDLVTADLNSILDLIAITMSTDFLNSANTTDLSLINTNKQINSTTGAEDSGEYFYQSYVKEDYFAEEYVGQKEFF